MHPHMLPPSSQKVLNLLQQGGSMTHKDIVKESNLAPRTVRYALKRLKEQGLILEKFNFRDARQIIYECRSMDSQRATA